MTVENQNTEFKRIWKDEYLKQVCSFANAQGGRIYIGIDDDMSVYGVTHLHQQLEDIPNKIVTMLGIVPVVNHLEKKGKDIIEIIIEHSNVPISYKGVFYMRSGATNQELRGLALQQFLMKKFGRSWEDTPCYGTTLDDIDPDAIQYFLERAVREGRMSAEAANSTPEEVIANLGLMEEGVPCNGAILLFGKYPQRKFVTSAFKIGRFGSTNFDLLSQEKVEGPLIQMPENVMRVLIDKYLIRPIHYAGLERKEPLEIPEDALREMICNAIVHRDHQGTWTQMSIYSDHIRLWNDGELPAGLSIEKLMGKHTSEPRNPKMAEAFYRAGFIEAWGRGIEKIVTGFKQEGLTPPTFTKEQGGITVQIPREKFVAINLGGAIDVNGGSEKNGRKDSEKTITADPKPIQADQKSMQIEPKPNQNRTKTEQKTEILRLIIGNPKISRVEIAATLEIHESSVQRRLESLMKDGRLRHVGPTNGGFWKVIGG